MKKFVSLLLVAILLVASMATSAFAVEANPGDTVTLTLSVSGEFANFTAQISAAPGLTIVGFGGVTGNPANGMVAYAAATNQTSHSFTVTVKVADGPAPGSYPISGSVTRASKTIPVEEDTDGIVDGLIATSVSFSGNVVTITCDHDWSDWTVVKEATCTEDGLMERVCSLCGEKETKTIPAAHSWTTVWKYNSSKHWHECSVCGLKKDEAGHTMILIDAVPPTPEENGFYLYDCEVCDYRYSDSWEWNEEPKVGDIRPMIFLGIAGVVSMLAAVSYVFKRKSVI